MIRISHTAAMLSAAAMLSSGVSGGCAKTAVFNYHRDYALEFPETDDSAPLVREARAELASARTVAFFPPSDCVDQRTLNNLDRDQEIMRLTCGVLLSQLERTAEEAGFSVVSWQTLRGSGRPIEYARESGVDVLFEINEFDLGTITEKDLRWTYKFFVENDTVPAAARLHGAFGERPVRVSSQTQDRCHVYASRASDTVALSGVLDIKMVRVRDGRNLWHYRRTRGEKLAVREPVVRFEGKRVPNGAFYGPLVSGLGALGLSLGLDVGYDATTPEDRDAKAKFVKIFGYSGAILTAIGVIGLIATPSPSADDSLCYPEYALLDAPAAQDAPEPTSEPSATKTYVAHVGGATNILKDQGRARFNEVDDQGRGRVAARRAMQEQLVVDFLRELVQVKRDAPTSPPAPTAPAPTPPAPTPPAPTAPAPTPSTMVPQPATPPS
jgi:hypothetical protein